MKKYTKKDIEKMVDKIVSFLKKNELDIDVFIYYNNKRLNVAEGIIEEDVNPLHYFEYASRQHIISVTFEGALYDLLNYNFCESAEEEFRTLLDKYGLYYELGNAWNLTYYPVKDNIEDYEYTSYYREKRKDPIRFSIYNKNDIPSDLLVILDQWYELVQYYGTNGSCILGDGIGFKWQGNSYFMSTNFNQSDSVDYVINEIKHSLELIGATEIYYDYGHMD